MKRGKSVRKTFRWNVITGNWFQACVCNTFTLYSAHYTGKINQMRLIVFGVYLFEGMRLIKWENGVCQHIRNETYVNHMQTLAKGFQLPGQINSNSKLIFSWNFLIFTNYFGISVKYMTNPFYALVWLFQEILEIVSFLQFM